MAKYLSPLTPSALRAAVGAATLWLVVVVGAVRPAAAQTGEGAAAFAARAPVLDGNVDAVWERAARLPLRRVVFGQPSGDADLSATYRALWNRTALYLLIEVRDDQRVNDSTQRYDDDGAEVYLDAGNKKLNTFGATDFQYYFSYGEDRAVESKHNAHRQGVRFVTRDTSAGYRMEIRLPWAVLKTDPPPLAGPATRTGLDVHVNDDDYGGTRDQFDDTEAMV
ncbi:MAG: CBM9 [uncultured Chloroflexia bacterium]|uniref:CBM9 n=1 Tax=uncultured Chloroflexia bacterium TaxID=1672391 RepID=A0A6J4N5T5_9CHLR|nr:MAG: CBM9 [uncultured Chloroflexia bacterium]